MRLILRLFAIGVTMVLWGVAGCAQKETAAPVPPAQAEPEQKKPFFLVAWMQSLSKLIPRPTKPPRALPPRLVGVVKSVNHDERFVLIDATNLSGIAPGALLITIANQQQSSNLRLSPLKSPPFLIADIASGNPSPGDKVFGP